MSGFIITLSHTSITNIKYRDYCCLECGKPMLERSGNTIYRVGDGQEIEEVMTPSDFRAVCVCGQEYRASINLDVGGRPSNLPLYMLPQTMFVKPTTDKRLRFVHCEDCGKAFYSISDRIDTVVDEAPPVVDTGRLGAMEVWCKFNKCQQRWAVMV